MPRVKNTLLIATLACVSSYQGMNPFSLEYLKTYVVGLGEHN